MIFTLIFICFCFSIFDFLKFGIYGFIVFVLVYVLIFINFILSVVAFAKYNKITNKTFKKLNNSISKEFKNKKWNYKINCVLILLFLIDLTLGILNYFFLKKENIIYLKNNDELKYTDNSKECVSPYGNKMKEKKMNWRI